MRDFWVQEWEAWQAVCKVAKESGAVTQDDLDTNVSESERNPSTPGLKLLNAIRRWGETKEELALHRQEALSESDPDNG